MTRSRVLPSQLARVTIAALALVAAGPSVRAQSRITAGGIKLKEPVASRVYQRDVNGHADIPIVLDESQTDARLTSVTIQGQNIPGGSVKFVDGKLTGVPTGGPYMANCRVQAGKTILDTLAGPFFVGDLWILAGQSNMEGVGDLIDVTPPNPQVMLLGMDGKWKTAEEPLHWLVDSPDPVHSGDPGTREERSARQHKNRRKGAGLGLPFAEALTHATGVPIGLIACAHGGTSMEQWNPSKKDQGGHSLYGSMMRQFHLAGGKVRGVLWYQGEAEANPQLSQKYPQVFAHFINAVRSDFGQPELPFYFVQIGRFVHAGDPKGWNAVQEAQRLLPERVPYTAVVSVIDLELDDAIHVGTQGQKRAGQRLARIAEREVFGMLGATTPTLDRVAKGPHNTLVVRFKGVNMGSPQAGGGPRGGPGNVLARPAMQGTMGGRLYNTPSASLSADAPGFGLMPARHIAGFSIRKADGTEIPLIFEAQVGTSRDTVILKLAGAVPPGSSLWYGHGYDPYCNLTDAMDMAVPVFGPIPLDEVLGSEAPAAAAASAKTSTSTSTSTATSSTSTAVSSKPAPIKALIITGDTVSAHAWKDTTKALEDMLEEGGRIAVDVTTTASKDLTDANLAKYDVLILNYRETPAGPPESRWSDANKQAFLKAVREGKGLVVYHHASSAFAKPNWEEFEKAVAGGWRSQGFHGPAHAFSVKKTGIKHPVSEGLPAQFDHPTDELYSGSMLTPGSVVLATAYSDPAKPRGSGKDEAVIWVNQYGKGRVYENVLGHDTRAMADPNFHKWMRRGVIWAATGKGE